MKVWVFHYLTQKKDGRDAALLKIQWNDEAIGFSDLSPLKSFGEEDLVTHLESIFSKKITSLAQRSLELNRVDAEYRTKKVNAFSGLQIPLSHKLVLAFSQVNLKLIEDILDQGFTHIKLKSGPSFINEASRFEDLVVKSKLRWRLDFNGCLETRTFNDWWQGLALEVKNKIDFIEDPVVENNQNLLAGPWAEDWIENKKADILILKPARSVANQRLSKHFKRVIFTHSMDHILGRVAACWSAAHFYSQYPDFTDVCGFGLEGAIKEDDFSRIWTGSGPRFFAPDGTGFGFDHILEALQWQSL